MPTVQFQSELPVSQQVLYNYHASGGAFARLIPPWDSIQIQDWKGGEATKSLEKYQQQGDISLGAEVHLRIKSGPIAIPLVAKHIRHQEPEGFTDLQIQGPFPHWEHHHQFIQLEEEKSQLVDEISYQAPLFGLSEPFVRAKISRTFAFRHQRTQRDLGLYLKYADLPRQKFLVSGASGLIGRNLCALLRTHGHTVYTLVRRKPASPYEIQWNIATQTIDIAALEGIDIVVHLAGESIDGRWSAQKKHRISESRIQGTKLLVDALMTLSNPPKTLVSTSAVGAYGNHAEEVATEETSLVDDFLGSVCQNWEKEALRAAEKNIRVVTPRLGVVLSGQGGALARMLPPFLAGVGGRLGAGKQWMSWIGLDDALGLLLDISLREEYLGPINLVAPNPVRNQEFTRILGKVIRRPTIFPVPSFMIKTIFGEMGQTLLLEGRKVLPEKALQKGYPFQFADLESLLRFELGR